MILDKLIVKITADTSGLKKGIDEAKRSVNEATNAAKQAGQFINQSLGHADMSSLKSQLKEEQQHLRDLQKEAREAASILRSFGKELRGSTLKEGIYEKRGGASWQNFIEYQANLSDAYDEQKIRVGELSAKLEQQRQRVSELSREYDKAKESAKKLNKEEGKTSGGGLGGIMKRILLYRVLRGVLSAITASVKEGIQYLAVYSQKLGDIAGYNKTMSQLATGFEKMKISISVTAMEFLQTIKPVLTILMTVVQQTFEGINALLAKVNGKKSYTIANPEYWKDYAKYVKESNSKLKETKTLIAGFDELNTLQPKASLFDSDNPLTIEKEINALDLAKLAWLGLIPAIKKIIDLFKRKNTSLKEQTTETGKETSAVRELAGAYGIATAKAFGLAGALAGVAVGVSALADKELAPDIIINPQPGLTAIDAIKQGLIKLGDFVHLPAIVIDTQQAETTLETVKAKLTEIGQVVARPIIEVGVATETAITTLTEFASNIKSKLDSVAESAQQSLAKVPVAIQQEMNKSAQVVSSFASRATNSISQFASSTLSKVSSWSSSFVSKIGTACSSALIKINGWASSAIGKVENVFNKIGNSASASTATVGATARGAFEPKNTSISTNASNVPRNAVVAKPTTQQQTIASKLWKQAGDWVSQNKSILIEAGLAAAAGAVTGAAIAAAIPTGGASLAVGLPTAGGITAAAGMTAAQGLTKIIDLTPYLPVYDVDKILDITEKLRGLGPAAGFAFANGGVVKKPTLGLVGEYAGASSNPEIIAPENKIREVMDSSNRQLADVYIQVGRQIISAIESKNFNVNIGDDQIARAAARGNQSYIRMTGRALI